MYSSPRAIPPVPFTVLVLKPVMEIFLITYSVHLTHLVLHSADTVQSVRVLHVLVIFKPLLSN